MVWINYIKRIWWFTYMFKILSDEISSEIWDLLIYTTGPQHQSRLKTSLGYNAEAIVYLETEEWVEDTKKWIFFFFGGGIQDRVSLCSLDCIETFNAD